MSMTCSVAIVVILKVYDSQPVPQWKHGLTLNAIISTLSTASKASLSLVVAEIISQHKWLWFRQSRRPLDDMSVFDSASRGPWGALKMLTKVHIRDVSSLSALVTVLALVFDPFIQ
ncbi:hypothetical protein A1O1_04064 [Capronia coronata CBS 617.96]|uniref:Uncharacterized protein n=1 Tax=Capronia coronata CBS 617.96 TaxID=1182541 RepID=W9YDL0_9EURO|nr:uncharacterized protein A1O1_04064 [Capronia coronata CBS 617.96]EXJ90957.1 hypothetical protein A1O1_04064 [Capronia coronata CBS 617.96]